MTIEVLIGLFVLALGLLLLESESPVYDLEQNSTTGKWL